MENIEVVVEALNFQFETDWRSSSLKLILFEACKLKCPLVYLAVDISWSKYLRGEESVYGSVWNFEEHRHYMNRNKISAHWQKQLCVYYIHNFNFLFIATVVMEVRKWQFTSEN